MKWQCSILYKDYNKTHSPYSPGHYKIKQMTIIKWFMVTLFGLSAYMSIVLIDEKREPITRGSAIIQVTLDILFIWYLLN